MKKIIISLFCFSIVINICFSQDSVFVEGLCVKQFLKKEISDKIKNEILRKSGKPFQQMIDYHTQSFYFTLKIDSNISLMEEKNVSSTLKCPDYKNLEVYMLPPFNDYVDSYINNKTITYETDFPKDCSYFILENDTVHLYKIYKVRAYALRVIVDNDYLNKQRNINMEINWNIDSSNISKKIPFFYAYLFYNCINIDCHYELQGFSHWSFLE